jgi:hypothetical protein
MSKRVIAALTEDLKERLTAALIAERLLPSLMAIAGNDPEMEDEMQLHPVFTVGDLRLVGAFWNVDWLMDGFVSGQVAAMAAHECGPHILDYIEDAEDLVNLVHATDPAKSAAIKMLADALQSAYNGKGVNEIAVIKLKGMETEMEVRLREAIDAVPDDPAMPPTYVQGPATVH